MREVSLDGARLICETVTSMCYQLDEETMVVLDITPEPLAQIGHEKQNARETLVLGLPALFSFEMVRCGERYGVIYEHLQEKTLGQQIMDDPDGFDRYLDLFTSLSRRIHATSVSPVRFRSMKDDYADKIGRLGDRITADEAAAILDSSRQRVSESYDVALRHQVPSGREVPASRELWATGDRPWRASPLDWCLRW